MASLARLLIFCSLGALFVTGCGDSGATDYGGEVKKVDAEKEKNFTGRFGKGAEGNPTGKPDATAVDVNR
jgi:hypothetical protein